MCDSRITKGETVLFCFCLAMVIFFGCKGLLEHGVQNLIYHLGSGVCVLFLAFYNFI